MTKSDAKIYHFSGVEESILLKEPKNARPSTVIAAAAAAAKSLQSCPTLCNSRAGSPPGSPVPGILQGRTLECVAISFNARK